MEFSLTNKDVELVDYCSYCNIKLDYRVVGFYKPHSPSLDRVIQSKGYVVDNVVICCHRCNRAKGDLTVEELLKIAENVAVIAERLRSNVGKTG